MIVYDDPNYTLTIFGESVTLPSDEMQQFIVEINNDWLAARYRPPRECLTDKYGRIVIGAAE